MNAASSKQNTKRYFLATKDGVNYLLSETSICILDALPVNSQLLYTELSDKSDIPLQTLHVFVGRLVKHKLVTKHSSVVEGRTRTSIGIAENVKIDRKLILVR